MLHWQAHGENFAADHSMYDGMYKSLKKEIDTWAEKTVYMCGTQSVDDISIMRIAINWLDRWSKFKSEAEIAFVPELDYQATAKNVIDELRKSGMLTLGIEDFLISSMNDHERNLYQLKQRFNLQKV